MTSPKTLTVQYTNTKTIPIDSTQKLFYGRYPYSVTLESSITAQSYKTKYDERAEKCAAHPGPTRLPKYSGYLYMGLDPRVGKLFPEDKSKYRANLTDTSVTVYFEHKVDYQEFCNKAAEYIARVSEPESDDTIIQMKEDHQLVFRDTLFHERYEFKVYLDPKSVYSQNPDAYREIEELFKDEAKSMTKIRMKTGYYSHERFRVVTNAHTTDLYRAERTTNNVVFFKDDETLVRWRLSTNCNYKKIEKAVLNNNKNKEGKQDASEPVQKVTGT